MKKTYITHMPNNIGAFLQASRCFADLGLNITRVSYNKAIDSHVLFIEVSGTTEQFRAADVRLEAIGYLPKDEMEPMVVLVEFKLRDLPGTVQRVLELIEKHHFNISYLSSQENGGAYQFFKMGLFVGDYNRFARFLEEARALCPVRVLDDHLSGKVLDNSIFYHSFIRNLGELMHVDANAQDELLINANLAMQTLDERGLLPYRTFDSIHSLAKLLSECRGDAFQPRISRMPIGSRSELILIEPNCGSNTAILRCDGKTLFIDSGYACYRAEMRALFRKLLPDFDAMEKRILITHADVDHCGLLPMFDTVVASAKSRACLEREFCGQDGFREQNPLHKPYIRMCKILTMYQPVNPAKIVVPWENARTADSVIDPIGSFRFGEMNFTVYEGAGGHLSGEIILMDFAHHIAFTGDVFVNLKDMTPEQKRYNSFAPILMTSVDTDPVLCAQERKAVFALLEGAHWKVFGAHGAVWET